jgi:ferrous iron transport protein A
MPIVFAPTDKTLRIVKVLADEKTKKHLASLGVVQNGEIEVVSSSNGNVIVVVKGVRLAINRDVATKILVA